jgi:hypothetical protein
MSTINVGRIVVDFAGSEEEARAFANEHGLQVAKPAKEYSSEELPSLTLPFNNKEELLAGQSKLEVLGWDRGSQHVHHPSSSQRGESNG